MNRIAATCSAALLALAAAGRAGADELRNVKTGQAIPDFALVTLDGGPITRVDLEGRVAVLVYVSAEQRRSEAAAVAARAVCRPLRADNVTLVLATTDADRAGYFRGRLAATGVTAPLMLDPGRELYGALGLVVLPTTIVVDARGRLAHVIASYKGDYEYVLAAYVEHARGAIDDEGLRTRLATRVIARDAPGEVVARHRAAAEVFRASGLLADAERELRLALEADPEHVGARLDLAGLLVRLGRVAEARAAVDVVLAAHPGHRRGGLVRGVVLYHAGDLAAARDALEAALVINADPTLTHYYLGLIDEREGRTEAALVHFKEALARILDERLP